MAFLDHSNYTENWMAFYSEDDSLPSFGRVHIHNESLLTFEQVSLETNKVVDTFSIVQDSHDKFSIEKLPPNIAKLINEQIDAEGGKLGE